MNKKNCLLFVVEDDIPCGKLIEYYLRKNGYSNIVVYTDGKAFISDMRKQPHVVIIDNRLKSMNGIELIRRAKEIFSDFYCILFTHLNYDEIRKNEKGWLVIDKYIRKGLHSLPELVSTLNTYSKTIFIEQYY
jgi:DNA-binding response OmpR family regulator